jgi:hypothetical protein
MRVLYLVEKIISVCDSRMTDVSIPVVPVALSCTPPAGWTTDLRNPGAVAFFSFAAKQLMEQSKECSIANFT